MTAHIIDGKAVSQALKNEVKTGIAQLKQKGVQPALAVILVGNNPASATYVRHKQKACEEVGIASHTHTLPEHSTQNALKALLHTLNHDPSVTGILLQLPLPAHMNPDDLLECIDPKKDVDGFHPYNLGRLAQRRPRLRPCTPYGVMRLLEATGIDCAGKHAVVVGASNIVGRPMALELLLAKATVTVCHRFTHNLQAQVEQADILVSATGHYGLIESKWIKQGAVVMDVGFSRLENGHITGDINFASACERASHITPVPGGVGPMTVASVVHNTLLAAQWQTEKKG